MIGHAKCILCFAVVLWFCATPVHADTTLEARERYSQLWLKKEKLSSDKFSRIKLSMDLLNAADKTSLKNYKVLLLEKSYLWGVRQTESYPTAAQALRQMEEADHSRRLYALDKLAGLYHRLYSAAPTKKLGDGKGLAQVRLMVAEQRLVDLISDHEEGRVSKVQFLAGLNKVKGDYHQSSQTATRVMASAKRYMRSTRSSAKKEALQNFIGEVQVTDKKVNKGKDALAKLQREYLAGVFGAPGFGSPTGDNGGGKKPPTQVASRPPAGKPATGLSTTPPKQATPDQPLSKIPSSSGKVSTLKGNNAGKRITHTCSNCRSRYLPDASGDSGLCYWCKKKDKSIFDLK